MPNKETLLLGKLGSKLRQFASDNRVNLNDIPDDLWLILTDRTTESLSRRPLYPDTEPKTWLTINAQMAEIYEEKQLALLQTWHQGNLDPEYVEAAFADKQLNPWWNLFVTIDENKQLILRPWTPAEMKNEFGLKFPDLAIGLTVAPCPEPVRLDLNQGQLVVAISSQPQDFKNRVQAAARTIGIHAILNPREPDTDRLFTTANNRQALPQPQLIVLTEPSKQMNQLINLVDARELKLEKLTLITVFKPEEWQELALNNQPTLNRSLQQADYILHCLDSSEHQRQNLPSRMMLVAPQDQESFPAWQLN